MKRVFFLLFSSILLLQSCQNVPQDDSIRIRFSVDTLLFDTVFTAQGSTTRKVMLYNDYKQPIKIKSIRRSINDCFYYNIDGEQFSKTENASQEIQNITLLGGDSLYIFVKAQIDPLLDNNPVLLSDQLLFTLENGITQVLEIEAFGQNVNLIDSIYYSENTTLDSSLPYLIRHYIASAPNTTITIPAGCTFYMHNNAFLQIQGSLHIEGTLEQPVVFTSDRLDDFVPEIPYRHVPGLWDGIYLLADNDPTANWNISHVQIISGVNALYCRAPQGDKRPTLSLTSSKLHNHDQYGLVLQNTDALVTNSEISNCASYCVYLSGGNYTFAHNTIASYFRSSAYPGIYDTQREDVAAVYINNISKTKETNVSFYNNIITGVRRNELLIATPLPEKYAGKFVCNYIKTDSLNLRNAHQNVYASEKDTVFRNSYYAEHIYYDFRLDSVSPARGIADSVVASQYPFDLIGTPRLRDAGCYQFINNN